MVKIYRRSDMGEPMQHTMETAFPFLGREKTKGVVSLAGADGKKKKAVVSLIGAGGKTTLMYELAREGAKIGLHTLVTTTTHIWKPEQKLMAKDLEKMRELWEQGSFAVMGQEASNQKLKMLPQEMLQSAMNEADLVLIEADGAKCLPCKVPAEGEPVLLPESDYIIGVAGMDAIGQPLCDGCFRVEQAMELLGVPRTHLLTEQDLAVILSSPKGTRKDVENRRYCVVLNKCDNEERKSSACKIAEQLEHMGIEDIIMTSFQETL